MENNYPKQVAQCQQKQPMEVHNASIVRPTTTIAALSVYAAFVSMFDEKMIQIAHYQFYFYLEAPTREMHFFEKNRKSRLTRWLVL